MPFKFEQKTFEMIQYIQLLKMMSKHIYIYIYIWTFVFVKILSFYLPSITKIKTITIPEILFI